MHDLRLVGVHEDGEHLVLTGPDGHRYRLSIDEPLRAAIRRDRARLGQLQIEMSDTLRPRDIQARIRAGQTAEHLAESAGLPLEHVRRFERPVLDERAHVAGEARKVTVRQARRRPTLDDLVAERLSARGADSETVTWDAWRPDGAPWTVQLRFTAAGRDRVAQWAFDIGGQLLEPLDDEARWLSAPAEDSDGPLAGSRRLMPVERVYDIDADGGVRPADGEDEATVPEYADGVSLDLLDALRDKRGRRQPVELLDDASDGELRPDDHMSYSALTHSTSGLPPAAHPPDSRADEFVDAEVLSLPGSKPEAEAMAPETSVAESDDVDERVHREPERATMPAQAANRRGRRTAVPSWDEIVFGSRKD